MMMNFLEFRFVWCDWNSTEGNIFYKQEVCITDILQKPIQVGCYLQDVVSYQISQAARLNMKLYQHDYVQKGKHLTNVFIHI